MTDIQLRYQVALFGSYEDITPTPGNLKYLIEAFEEKGLIPTTTQELGTNGTINRLSLQSQDRSLNISIGINRIDIERLNQSIGEVKMGSLESFAEEVMDIITVFEDKFPKKHHRISLITRELLKEMDDQEFNAVYRKLANPIPYFLKHDIVDWNTRSVSRIPFNIGDNDEMINVICQTNRLTGNLLQLDSKTLPIDRVEINFDINTYQINNEYRFDVNAIKDYLSVVVELKNTLLGEYLKLIEE